MKPTIFILSILMAITICNSCFLTDECDGLRNEQLLQFGEYQIRIDSKSDTLSIGDSIRFRIKMPNTLFDSISLSQVEVETIELGFYVTRDTDEPKDTSLIYIFDQYFDILVTQGEMFDPYHFSLKENNSEFELDFYYVCKKELKYFIPIRFDRIIAKDVDTKCMLGDTETWNARITIDSDYNTYDNQGELGNYFGFVVQ